MSKSFSPSVQNWSEKRKTPGFYRKNIPVMLYLANVYRGCPPAIYYSI